MKRTKYDFYNASSESTVLFTAYDSGWMNNPTIYMSKSTWDSPPIRTNITFDKPANNAGGMFADPYPSWGGKLLTLAIRVHNSDPYVAYTESQKIRKMPLTDDFISIKRTIQFTNSGKQVVSWLKGCVFTDISEVDNPSRNKYEFAMVFKSQNRDSSTPVETNI